MNFPVNRNARYNITITNTEMSSQKRKGESLNARNEENTDGQNVPQWSPEITDHKQALVEELLCPEKDPKLT